MATGGGPRSLSDVVECDICMEIMTRPQALSCMHHLCKNCSDKLDQVREKGVIGVSCPTCRVFTAVTDIKDSFMMNTLIDIYNNKQSSEETEHSNQRKCMQCDRAEATSVCNECRIELCNTCKIGHLRIPSCRQHHVIDKDEHKTENVTEVNVLINIIKYCPKHPTYPIKYNCVPCNKAVCSECKIEEHDVHETESVEKALKKMLTQTKSHIATIHDHKLTMEQNLKQVRKIKVECQSMCDTTKNSIQQHTEMLMAKLRADSQELIEEVDEQIQAKMKELNLLEADFEHQVASQESLLSWSNTVVQTAEGPGVLCELQDGLYQRIEACAKKSPSTEPAEVQIPEMKFTPNKFNLEQKAVGKLETRKKSVSLQPATRMRQLPVTSWPAMPVQRSAASNPPVVSFLTTTTDLTTLKDKPFTKTHGFKLKRYCSRMCYFKGYFWFPCDDAADSCIDVYNSRGQLVNTLQSEQIRCPRLVHPLNDQQLMVASQNGLYVTNIDGKVNKKILDGFFFDVHRNKNIIVALQKITKSDQDVVHLLQNTDPPTVHSHFRLDNNNSQRVMITDQHIFVSFHESKKQSFIAQYSLTGDRLFQYGSYGSGGAGLLRLPLLCSLDPQGSLLVADYLNQRFQVLDSRGQWSKIKDLQEDMFPGDVVFTSDNIMWVLFFNATEKKYYLQNYKF